MGGVSISNQFSDFSKSLMIEFMKSHYYDPYIAQYIQPKKEFKVKLKDADKDFVFDAAKADMQKFDKVIDEIEPALFHLLLYQIFAYQLLRHQKQNLCLHLLI